MVICRSSLRYVWNIIQITDKQPIASQTSQRKKRHPTTQGWICKQLRNKKENKYREHDRAHYICLVILLNMSIWVDRSLAGSPVARY